MTIRIHLAQCEYCGRKIAWSRKRRHWLALAPITSLPGRAIGRRLTCVESRNGTFHDPITNVLDRYFRRQHVRGRAS